MKLSLQIAVFSAAILGGVLGFPNPNGNPVQVELEVDVKELKEKRTEGGFKEPVKVTKVTFVNLSEDDRKKLSLFGTNIEININKDEEKELITLPNYVSANANNFQGEHIGGSVILPVLMPFPLGLFFPSPPLNLSLGFNTNRNVSLGLYAGPSGGPNAGGGDNDDGDGWGWDSGATQGWTTPAPQGWSSTTQGWTTPGWSSTTQGWTTPGWSSPTQGWPSTTTTQGWTTPGWGWGSGVRKAPIGGGGGFQMPSKPQNNNNNNNAFAPVPDIPVPAFGKPGPTNLGFKPIPMNGEGTTIETVAHQSSSSSESSVIDAIGNSPSAAEISAVPDIPVQPANAEAPEPVVPVDAAPVPEAAKISLKSRRHADQVDDEIHNQKKSQEVIPEPEVAPEDVSHHEDKKEAHEEEESRPVEDSVDLRNTNESESPAAEVEASNPENQPQNGKGRKPRPHGNRDKPSKSRPTLDSGMKDKNAEHFGLPHQNPSSSATSFQSIQDSSQKDQTGYPNVLGWQLPSFKWSSFSEIFQSFMGSTTTGAMTHIKKSPAQENLNMDMGKSDSPADDEADEAEKCIDDEDVDEDVGGIRSPVIHAHALCSTAPNGKANDCNTACVGKGFSGGTCLGPHPTPGCLCKMPNTKDYSMLLTPLNKDQKEIPQKCKKCACADACTKSGSFTGLCMDQCYCAVPWFAKSD